MKRQLVAVALLGCASFVDCADVPPGTLHGRAGQSQAGSLSSGGRTRTFWFHLPTTDVAGSRPLLISLHGRLAQGKNQETLSGFSELADRRGLVAVYPDGIGRSWADARGTSNASKEGVDDIQLLSDLIDLFVREQRIDPSRVYLNGMSNGAMMALTAACRLSNRLAAVGAVAGLVPAALAASCAPARPVPVMLVAGTEDPRVPYLGGEMASGHGKLLSAVDSVALWSRLDGCQPVPHECTPAGLAPDEGMDTTRRAYRACKGGAQVELETVRGGGHTWPGGPQYLPAFLIGHTTHGFSASELFLDFATKPEPAWQP